MTKKILFLLTFLLTTLGGGNSAWADRYVITWHDGNAHQYVNAQETGTFFDWDSGKHNINTKFVGANDKPEYTDNSIGTITFSAGLKLESNTENKDDATRVSFNVTNSSTLTILKSTYSGGDKNIKLYNNTTNTLVGTYDGTDSGEGYKEIRVQGLPAGSYSIMRGDGEAGLLYVRVSDDAFAMNVRYNDIMLGNYNSSPRINVTNEFAYVAPNTYGSNQGATYLRVCLKGTSAFTNDDYFSVESSNTSVLLVDDDATSKNYLKSGDNTQAYLFVKVTGYSADPVTLTFNYNNGSDVSSCTGTFTVNPGTMTPYNSYPYKWDFQNNEWTSTRLQLDNSTMGGAWTKTSANAVIKQDINTSVVSDINMIKTLAFEAVNEGLTLDWTNKKVSLVAGSKIRIPGDLSGRIVTFDASGEFAWDSEGTVTKMAANKFYVSSGTGVIFSNANAVDIYSIDVSETGVATYETTSAGVFQFTGNGTLAGGTVINDVPGIEITIGTSGNSITVNNATVSNTDRLTNSSECPPNRGYTFTPTVNGYLTVTVWGAQNLNLYDGDTNYEAGGEINVNGGKTITFTKPLIAGHTYYFVGSHDSYPIWLHSFSYEPAFLNITKTGRQSAENPAVFDATGSTTVFPSILTDANENVTFAASEGGAITVAANGNGTPTLVTPTSNPYTITATIASPNSSVTAKTAKYQLIYTATAINLTYQWSQYTNTPFVDGGTYKQEIYAKRADNGADVTLEIDTWTYSSSDESIATVSNDGTLTIHNSGQVTITVTANDTDYQSATTTYTLTINPDTDVTLTLSHEGDHEFTFGNNYINPGSISVEGPTITYESSNTAVATVNSSGTVIGVKPSDDWVTITVRSSQYKQYRAASKSYKVKVKKGTLPLQFVPGSIVLNQGEYVIPHMNVPNIVASIIENSITINTTNSSVAALDNPAYELVLTPEGYLNRMNVKITGGNHGGATDQTATVTASVSGNEYYEDVTTSIKVNVRANAQQNFSWKSGEEIPEYTIYQGDFMLIPPIDGNCSHNADYSLQSKNKYPKKIGSNQNISKNMDKDYRPNEGVPNYMIVNAKNDGSAPDKGTSASNDYAYVVFAQAQGSSRTGDEPDSLMVYAKIDNLTTDHVVYLRAVDSNNSDYYCDAKITIKPKATLDDAFNSDVADMSFPFTWDFTQFSSVDFALLGNDKVYYEPKNNGASFYLGSGYMNSKNSLDPGSNKTISKAKSNELYFQNMVVRTNDGNLKTLKQFKGLRIALNGTYYNSKIDRVRINSTSPHLTFIGGPTEFLLPTVASMPSSFKVFVKLKGTSGKKVYFRQGNPAESSLSMTGNDQIVSFDATNSGGDITLRFEDCSVYWIACSTEAKNLSYFKHSNSNLTYAAAAYSYPEDLDLSKSNEVNGATAYYASSFTKDNDAQGAYSNDPEQQYAVVMSPLSNLGTYVTKGTGMLLKYDNLSGIDVTKNDATIPFNMIANPRNVETYSAEETVTGTNYLIGTGSSSPTITGHETIESVDYTNFMMSAAYKYYTDITDVNTAQGDYRFDRDWSFYPVMNTGSVGPQKSYLHIPGNLYVNKEGKIVDIPASSRSYGRAADNDTPGAPASRGALSIVFDDDPSNGQGTTGISTVATETTVDSDAWYTLQGVRVNAPAKGGIYIYKGKKVVVK